MSDATEQGSHHFVLTVQKPSPQGFSHNSFHGTYTPPAGTSRADAYAQIRAEYDRVNPQMAQGTVLFWSLEPNQL